MDEELTKTNWDAYWDEYEARKRREEEEERLGKVEPEEWDVENIRRKMNYYKK